MNRFPLFMKFAIVFFVFAGVFLFSCNQKTGSRVQGGWQPFPEHIKNQLVKYQKEVDNGASCPTGGYKIHIPKGNYLVKRWDLAIFRFPCLHISGDGIDKTILKFVQAGPSDVAASWDLIFVLENVNNFTLENMTLDGNRDKRRMAPALKDSDSQNNSKDGFNAPWAHIVNIRGCKNGKLKNLHIKNSVCDGITIESRVADKIPHCRNITIQNCIVENSRRANLSIINGHNILVENSEFKNANGHAPQSGIRVEENGSKFKDENIQLPSSSKLKFIDNKISDNKRDGISIEHFFHVEDVIIRGNKISNSGHFGILCKAKEVKITDNDVVNSGHTGILCSRIQKEYDYGKVYTKHNNFQVTSNRVNGACENGISITDTQFLIKSNEVQNCGESGILCNDGPHSKTAKISKSSVRTWVSGNTVTSSSATKSKVKPIKVGDVSLKEYSEKSTNNTLKYTKEKSTLPCLQ